MAPSDFDVLAGTLLLAAPGEVGELQVDLGTDDPATLDGLHAALLADGSRIEFLAMLDAMDGRESLAIDEFAVRIDPARWGRCRTPTCGRPPTGRLLPALQDRLVAEADAAMPDNPFTTMDVDTSHLGVQLHPEPLATILLGLEAVTRSGAR